MCAVTVSFAGPGEIIIDNTDSGFAVESGTWFPSANPGFFGTNSLVGGTSGPTGSVRWTADLSTTGEYEVFAWWVASGNRAADAPYRVNASTGAATVFANQTTNSAQWNSLGTFIFNAGERSVELSTETTTGDFVSADAVRWAFIRETDPVVPCTDEPTAIDNLGGFGNCFGFDLPGAPEPHPEARWALHSDLPELFSSYGVLYSSRAVLPEDSGDTVPLNLRTQTNNGFTTIDDDFDVFLFHITIGAGLPSATRIVIHVRNNGSNPEIIRPSQVIRTTGTIGNEHEMESTLGRRWVEGDYDLRPAEYTIPAGGEAVIAWSDVFGPPGRNCFGMVHGDVVDPDSETDLEVSVVAIPGVSQGQILSETSSWLEVAATSADSVPITTPPGASELRRAVGMFPNFQWRSETPTIDAVSLPPTGTAFQMALSEIQAASCIDGRQTVDMALHPGYAHGDTIGNYMVDYRVSFHLVNSSRTEPKAFDLTFGRTDADIGLAWRVAANSSPVGDEDVDMQPVTTEWAGPNQSDVILFDSLLEPVGGSITLPPCGERYVALRFIVLGNSSLPFQINVEPAEPDPLPLVDVWLLE